MEPQSNPVTSYFRQVFHIIRRPTEFFNQSQTQSGLTTPLVFAIVTNWIASAISFLWGQLASESSLFLMQSINQRWPFLGADRIHQWIWGVGSVLLSPFQTLLLYPFWALFLFLGLKIFVDSRSSKPVTYESALKIVCYASAPAYFVLLPFVGGLVAGIYTFVVLVIGFREEFQITSGRAVLVAAFPQLLSLLGLFFVAAAAFLGIFSFISLA